MISYSNSVIRRQVYPSGVTAYVDATVTVRNATTGGIVTIYDGLGQPTDNPFNPDDDGNYTFYADSGTYDIVINEGLDNEYIIPAVRLNESNIFSYDSKEVAESQATPVTGDVIVCARYYDGGDSVEGLVYDCYSVGTVTPIDYVDAVFVNGAVGVLRRGEVINANQAGAVYDGSDAYDVLQAVGSLPVVISGNIGLSQPITGVDSIDWRLDGADIVGISSAGAVLNIKDMSITGKGKFSGFTSYVTKTETGNALNRVNICGEIEVDGNGTTVSLFCCDPGVTSDSAPSICISGVEGYGFEYAGICYPMDANDDSASAVVSNCYFHDGKGRGIQFGDNENRYKNVTVNINRCFDIISTGSAEAKGILVYGENFSISKNTVTRIKNGGTSGAEGIYAKSSFGSIINNQLLDAGSSSDGCITLKGAGYIDGDLYPDTGDYSVISGNTVTMSDITYDSKGIGIFDSNVICSDNILKDLRSGRAALTYSMAISVGGSSPVANVIVKGNVSNGWNSFSGDFTETSKGRNRWADNVKIINNTATNMTGGANSYGVVWRSDCITTTGTFIFDSATKTVTIDGGLAQNREWEESIYPVGSSIIVTGTTSNNGTYTVAAVTRYVLTFVEAIANETSTGASFAREEVLGAEIRGNTFQGANYAIRNAGGTNATLNIDHNTYINCVYAYRLDTAGGIGSLMLGSGETFSNVTNIDYVTPVATTTRRGVNVTSSTGTEIVLTDYNGNNFTVTYT